MMRLSRLVIAALCLLLASTAQAQQTGSITGSVSDTSGAVLPGVIVSVEGANLIGGAQTYTTDVTGNYRFDRLPPGDYTVKFELQGFKTVQQDAIRINAAFVATINAKLEVGSLEETITVTGQSPTVDVRSNVQQTVMSQEILEGVPTGRDPWSLAKLIPGVQVATYDVGGTQSVQQSSMSAHGSNTNDVSYNIDGATVNWPGGGGGATMMYYDQGMFEEVNYMTSAIPAETLAGGVSINMVTKAGGNQWRGNARYSSPTTISSPRTGPTRRPSIPRSSATRPRRPTTSTCRAAARSSRTGCGSTAPIRKWVVNKLVNARNPDGTQALDDNDLKNYSGKVVAQIYAEQQDARRRTSGTTRSAVIAATRRRTSWRTSPRWCRPTRSRRRRRSTPASGAALVFESNFQRDGRPDQLHLPARHAGRRDPPRRQRAVGSALAATREEHQPNSRHQFDNVISIGKSGWGGEHLFKGGVQWGRLYYESDYSVQGDHYVEYNNGVPAQVRQFNTPDDFEEHRHGHWASSCRTPGR